MDEQNRQRALQQQDELILREREYNERQERERQQREQYGAAGAHQSNTGTIPIHQPVASRLPSTIHSPGGLLAKHGGAPPGPLGAPSGPSNAFGGPLHGDGNRNIQHNTQPAAQQLQQHQAFGPGILGHHAAPSNAPHGVSGGPGAAFGNALQQEAASRLQQIPFGPPVTPAHQIPGAPALGQGGQQPILNDALSYLDQVKVQFADQPDVYNRFLDIMKDFKSQAIDTPGVINRVSELFAGHPNLIQGFNTFLPPGYRIECGTGNDPNTIRVTTPMGTTVQSITGAGRPPLPDSSIGQGGANNAYYGNQRPGNWQQPQHSIESPEGVFSPPNQTGGAPFNHNQAHSSYEAQQAAAAAHQQQQRGVSQLTNAVATTLGHPPRNAHTPTPSNQSSMNNGSGPPGLEKRGPVEFNHAISYVNKIKNRFQDRPEIYKQFLEILQTYQRESKPIQDVYAQVTFLFNTAPDLLEDFKQFLPESAAQAKAAAAAKAAEEVAALATSTQTSQASHGPRGESKMPPVGNFAVPASTSKESKKRPRNNTSTISGPQPNVVGESAVRGSMAPAGKRPKLHHGKPMASDAPAVSPTLTPVIPEPLPPTTTTSANSEELAFFDRVKKYIANKSTMNEFLKLCNLFSQDLIDRNVLVHKISNFIGGNPDLMNWFKTFVNYDGDDEVIDNRPKAPTSRVVLSNCRGLGPSYRLLPKRERLKPCSGRDEMCHTVLNDDWASHPTWASEDSGFVAHRKNIFEESLHRIEEERHDYDFNIEANTKVIQLLEPIGQSLLAMDANDRENFRMPIGLGGQSQSIYKRVLKKIYGPERGPDVAADLFKDPCSVLPIVLARLKQKDEEWRFTQREWEKVWHAQTQTMYLKSLDHMGLQVKAADKKNFAMKHLIDSIKTKHEEQRRRAGSKRRGALHQFAYEFNDQGVIADVLRIMIVYATNSSQHNSAERRRITEFFEKFITTFFDISDELLTDRTGDIDRGTPDEDLDDATPSELPNGRGRRVNNGKRTDLRRGVLDKARNGRGRSQKEDSTTGSKESTPDVDSLGEDDAVEAEDQAAAEVTNDRWLALPGAAAIQGTRPLDVSDLELIADQPYKREYFSLYCNSPIYVLFSIFQTLYRRLKEIKESEADAVSAGNRARVPKPAKEIGLLDEKNDHYGPADGESYYARTLTLIEDFVTGDLEEAKYQDFLRHFYLKKGWQLYTIMDLLKSLCRQGVICSSNDAKERTPDLLEQFYHDKELKEGSFNIEINLRKQADKYIKDGEVFVIRWHPKKSEVTVRWMKKDETTLDLDDMELKDRWQYYVSSYVRVEPTEGVPRDDRMRRSLLMRNLPDAETLAEDATNPKKPLVFVEDLSLRICVNSFKIIYRAPGSEYYLYTNNPLTWNKDEDSSSARLRLQKYEEARNEKFQENFEMNNEWMKGLDHDEVQNITLACKKWIEDGILANKDDPDSTMVE